jgi:hypothetical protein
MRKTTVPLVVALVVSCLLNGLGAPRKKIVIVVHEFPNYVFHLLTLGGIVADPEYAKAYRSTLPEADRLYLESNKKNLEWGNGGLGPFTAAFLFVPGYINPGTRDEVDEYFDLLNRALRNDDPGPIVSKYRGHLDRVRAFIPFDFGPYLHSLVPQKEAVARVSEIFQRNYAAYDRDIWPVERRKIEAVAAKLNPELEARDFIGRWEKLTGLDFKADTYEIVLYTANARGSNANSLAYDRNTFYYGKDPGWMLQFLSHETGTHILIDVMNQVASTGKYPFPVAYKAYETMCEFYNTRFVLAGEKPLYDMKNYDDAKFLSIYGEIFDLNRGIKPADLLVRGIDAYLRTGNR